MLTVKDIIAQMRAGPDPSALSLEEARAMVDGIGALNPVATDVSFTFDQAGDSEVVWCAVPGLDHQSAILYLHGGAFMTGSHRSHGGLAAEIARKTGAPALFVNYRLAPEYPYPAGLEDAIAAYRYLMDWGIAGSRTAIVADSSGCALALAMMRSLRDLGVPGPCAAWLIGPWVDLSCESDSMMKLADNDPSVDRAMLQKAAQAFLGDKHSADQDVILGHGDLAGLPPLLIQAGAEEALLDDAFLIARHAALSGAETSLRIVPEVFHVWHLFRDLPEAIEAIAEGADFLKTHLRAQD